MLKGKMLKSYTDCGHVTLPAGMEVDYEVRGSKAEVIYEFVNPTTKKVHRLSKTVNKKDVMQVKK